MSTQLKCRNEKDEECTNCLQEATLFYLQLIMSDMGEEEEEKEAINYIKSNHNLLVATVKLINDTTEHKRNTVWSQTAESVKPSMDSDTSRFDLTCASNVTAICQTYKSNDGRKISKPVVRNELYPKRIRRSKYYDIDGDLSHIHRDPKYLKRNRMKNEKLIQEAEKRPKQQIRDKSASSYDESNTVNSIRIFNRILQDSIHRPTAQSHVTAGVNSEEILNIPNNEQTSLDNNQEIHIESSEGHENHDFAELRLKSVAENPSNVWSIKQNSEEMKTFFQQILGL